MNTKTFTASEARKQLYSLIKSASKGLNTYEITMRGTDNPVVLISKSELESWQETLDILSNPEERDAICQSMKETERITYEEALAELDIA